MIRQLAAGAAAFAAASVTLTGVVAAATPTVIPAPTGPHPVGARSFQLTDSARAELYPNGTSPRRFMMTAWYPTTTTGTPMPYASANWFNDWTIGNAYASGLADSGMASNITGKYTHSVVNAAVDIGPAGSTLPTVIVSPGFGMGRITETALAEELASYGYLVITLGHVYEVLAEETPQGVKSQYRAQLNDWYWRTALDTRVGDIETTLNQLPGLAYGVGAASRPNQVAVIGHSYGGVAAFVAADSDNRISSIVSLDSSAGWHYDGTDHYATHGLPCETLSLSLENTLTYPTAGAGAITYPYWNEMLAAGTNDYPFYDVRVVGAQHHAFTDVAVLVTSAKRTQTGYLGTIAPARAVELTRSYVRAFLNHTLVGQALDPRFLNSDPAWPDVVVH